MVVLLKAGPTDDNVILTSPECNEQGIFQKDQLVFRAGDHLVSVRSDAVAEYLLRTSVLTRSQIEQEEAAKGGLF